MATENIELTEEWTQISDGSATVFVEPYGALSARWAIADATPAENLIGHEFGKVTFQSQPVYARASHGTATLIVTTLGD